MSPQASLDGTARLWQLGGAVDAAAAGPAPPAVLAASLTLDGHVAPLTDVQLDRMGALCVTTSEDCTARVYEVDSGALLLATPPQAHARVVNTAAWAPSGRTVTTASDDETVKRTSLPTCWGGGGGHVAGGMLLRGAFGA